MSDDYAVNHYENFPVASVLLPRRLRRPVRIIYRFARAADDFADEGDLPAEERLRLLDGFRAQLALIERGETPQEALFADLAEIIRQYQLPIQLFYDLLSAFSQDVSKTRYADFGEVMDYCRRSANPIGRLLLHLYGETDERNLAHSDAICSALQVINFLQDVAIDYKKDRIYLPQDEMEKYRIREQHIAAGDTGGMWVPFIMPQIERARKLLQGGAPLGKKLPGRLGLEMRLIIAGGETILRKLYESKGDMYNQRPVLQPYDWLKMLWKALRAK